MPDLFSFESLAALAALTALEVVLGIDNVVFIAIMTGRLNPSVQAKARRLGLGLAMILRIVLLFTISWLMGLTRPLLDIFGLTLTGRHLVLLAGGLFLLAKATHEIHGQLEGPDVPAGVKRAAASFGLTVAQIGVLDLVFSLDSVITAVGMARRIEIMVAAIIIAVVVMVVFSGIISAFIERHPTVRMLALSFLLLVGVMLVADGLGRHVERGYIYFAMAFSLFVELLNMKIRKKQAMA